MSHINDFGPKGIRGLEIRSLQDLYGEIMVTDLIELINFTEETTLYHRVRMQRLADLEKEGRLRWDNLEKIDKEQAQLWWGVRARKIVGEEGMKVTRKKEAEVQKEEVMDWARKYGSKIEQQNAQKAVDITKKKKVEDWMEGDWMKENEEGQDETEWEGIRKILCGEVGTRKRKEERENKKEQEETKSRFRQDLEQRIQIKADTELQVYTDGSASKGQAGSGVWCDNMKRQRTQFRVLGTQDAYNGELQAMMYAMTNWPQRQKSRSKLTMQQ